MRILFLTSTLPRFPGDMQANFVGEQALAWKKARPNDEIVILAPHDAGAPTREEWDGVEVVRFRYFKPERWQRLAYPAIVPNLKRRPWLAAQIPPFLVGQYRAARRLIADRGIDLVYAHWVMPQGLIAYLLNRRFGLPYVLQNHSSDLSIFAALGAPGRRAARAIIHKSLRLFVVNEKQREFALSLFPMGERRAAAAKIKSLPMGVSDPCETDPSGFSYDFATISRLSRKKGIDHFIAAARSLARSGHEFRIAIAGDGEDAADLRSMAEGANIDFLGFVRGREKALLFDSARAFVVPSVAAGSDVEGMPVALLEALCRGKPVVASKDSNVTLLPEWQQIRDFVFLLEDPRNVDAFAAALKAAATYMADADSGASERLRQTMARYLWPNLIKEYQDALQLASKEKA